MNSRKKTFETTLQLKSNEKRYVVLNGQVLKFQFWNLPLEHTKKRGSCGDLMMGFSRRRQELYTIPLEFEPFNEVGVND